MAAPDLDVIKEIPGYKVILKAVLKSQIQQLVEQLAANTDEESVILTASVADGTLSHLGSESGKTFLEDHEDIKSQFLGHCLKRHHRKKQAEKERLEAETLQQSMQQTSPVHYGGAMGGPFSGRSPRFSSPRGPIHPVALTRASPGATGRSPSARHEPYPVVRPKRTSLNFEPSRGPGPRPSGTIKGSEQVIKIEPDDGETSNQSESGSVSQDNIQSTSQSPQQSKTAAKSESEDKDDDAKSESSNSTIPNEPPAEGLSLDSDLSNLISEQNQQHSQQGSDNGEMDPNVRVKLEALAESEMDLEITGVEPGRPQVSQDNWNPNVSMGMNFDPTGATGSAGDTPAGYKGKKRGRPLGSKNKKKKIGGSSDSKSGILEKIKSGSIEGDESDHATSEVISNTDGESRSVGEKEASDQDFDTDLYGKYGLVGEKTIQIRGTYKKYTDKEKAIISKQARQNGIRATAKKYGISKSTVDYWMKTDFSYINVEGDLDDDIDVVEEDRHASSDTCYVKSPFDDQICSFLLEKKNKGEKVTTNMMCSYAEQLLQNVSTKVSISRTWAWNFLREHLKFLNYHNIDITE